MRPLAWLPLLLVLAACGGRPKNPTTPPPQPIAAVTDSNPVSRIADSLVRRPGAGGTVAPSGRRFAVDTTMSPDQRFVQLVAIRLGQGLDLIHDVEHRVQVGDFHAALLPLDNKWGSEQLSAFQMLHSLFGQDSVTIVAQRARRLVDSLGALGGYPAPSMVWKALAEHNRRTVAIFDVLIPQLKTEGVQKLAAALREERMREVSAFEAQAASEGR